jgi:hypothetical protein
MTTRGKPTISNSHARGSMGWSVAFAVPVIWFIDVPGRGSIFIQGWRLPNNP